MVFNIDLGTGVLMIVAFLIAISLMGAWQAYGFMASENCHDHIESKLTTWREGMNAPEAVRGTKSDWIVIGRDCVEFLDSDGIMFKGNTEITIIPVDKNRRMTFEFTGDKLPSRDARYDVKVDEKRAAVIFEGA